MQKKLLCYCTIHVGGLQRRERHKSIKASEHAHRQDDCLNQNVDHSTRHFIGVIKIFRFLLNSVHLRRHFVFLKSVSQLAK